MIGKEEFYVRVLLFLNDDKKLCFNFYLKKVVVAPLLELH